MKANELRIGNWFIYKEQYISIKSIMPDNFGYNEFKTIELISEIVCLNKKFLIKDLEPIPLTTEILDNCGFRKDNSYQLPKNAKAFIKDNISIIGYTDDNIYFYEYTPTRRFNTVHQLQNLYFALIGEELEVKL